MGIFASQSSLFVRYRARLEFRDKLMGGVPHDPKLIEGWLRAKAGLTDDVDELRVALLRTMSEMGADVRPDMSFEEVQAASESLAGVKETTGFKRGEEGLYIESRQVKAMLKETTNILYAAERVGPTKKGPRSFLAERVFVSPDRIWLGRKEPDGVEMIIGHVSGPAGARSTLGYHEYVLRTSIEFDVLVARDAIPGEWWPDMWTHAQENGLGALRSQGYGRFDILQWDRVELTSTAPIPKAFASALS